jgi:hypothetical protein
MNDTELLSLAEAQRLTATRIVSESGVIPLLSKYGKCTVVGSFMYDLMYGSDIDLVVETEDPRNSSLAAIKELMDNRQFQKYQYGDFEKFPKPGRPKSFIVVLISDIQGVRWETEIWFQESYPQDKIDIDNLVKTKLTPENRMAILRLKYEREVSGDDKHKLSSTDIYKAVLVDGVTDYKTILTNLNKPKV